MNTCTLDHSAVLSLFVAVFAYYIPR